MVSLGTVGRVEQQRETAGGDIWEIWIGVKKNGHICCLQATVGVRSSQPTPKMIEQGFNNSVLDYVFMN